MHTGVTAMSWLRLKLLAWLWAPGAQSSGACANRRWWRRMIGPCEVTITMRHTGGPDGYSREELIDMLAEVRKHEALQGWRVPDG
jgi:hypothetical protein